MAYTEPRRIRYSPEVLLGTSLGDLGASTKSRLFNFSIFDPRIVTLQALTPTQDATTDLLLSRNGRVNEFSLKASALKAYDQPLFDTDEITLEAKTSLILEALASGAVSGLRCRAKYKVVNPSRTVETLLDGLKEVKEVAVRLTTLTSTAQDVGEAFSVSSGEKVVLLGITADAAEADTFLRINRDEDTGLQAIMDLHTRCLGGINNLCRCYVPFLDSFSIQAYTTTPVAALNARYRYAVCELTDADKAAWRVD